MAASETSIANLAFSHIGQVRVENISEPDPTARWALEFFPHARDYVTELHLWRYCKRTVALTPLVNDRPADFAYAYQRPSDCLSFKLVLPSRGGFDPRNPIRFDPEGDVIYTNEPEARGIYARQVTDVTRFPPSIDSAISWYLAHLLVQPLRLENALLTSTARSFGDAVNHAIATGAVEEALLMIKDADEALPDWMMAR